MTNVARFRHPSTDDCRVLITLSVQLCDVYSAMVNWAYNRVARVCRRQLISLNSTEAQIRRCIWSLEDIC